MANLDEWLDSIEHANLYRKSETFSTLGLIFSRYSTFFSNSEKIRPFKSLFLEGKGVMFWSYLTVCW